MRWHLFVRGRYLGTVRATRAQLTRELRKTGRTWTWYPLGHTVEIS